MNEPGFRFCGGCGARQQGSVVSSGAAPPPGQPKMVSDGVGMGAGAAETMRPSRLSASAAGMSAADLTGLAGRSRRPLAVLLVVDAALAIAGGLLLRAGLAEAGIGPSALGEAAPVVEGSAPSSAAASAAKEAMKGEPSIEPPAPPTSRVDPRAAPSAAAPAGGVAPGEPTPGQPVDAGNGAGIGAAIGAANDAANNAAKKKKKADKAVGRAVAEGPVDPYMPAADLSSQLNKLFSKGQAKLDRCHASISRGTGPAQLTVSFRVMADGSLGGARVLGAPEGSELLSMCVVAELAKWKVQSGESGEFVRRIRFGKAR
jgi:hypothetical protein